MIVCRRNPLLLIICFLVAAGLVFSGDAVAEMQIFNLQHKPAAELAAMAREFVSDGTKIAAHRNTLVVNSSAAEIAVVAELVKNYDRPMRMLKISVEQGGSMVSTDSDLIYRGRVDDENVKARLAGRPVPDDSSVFISTGNVGVGLSGQSSERQEKRSVSQFLSVLEGSPASISIGHLVPYTSQLRYYSRRHPHYVESVEYQNVDTGFQVLPEVHGDMVTLSIAPFMSFQDARRPQQIVFQESTSTISIPLGSWFDLAGQMADKDTLSREILGFGASKAASRNRVRVRVNVYD